MTTFQKLSDDLNEALGVDLPLVDEWRSYTHHMIVDDNFGWEAYALQLSVEPGRGRRAASIMAHIVVDGEHEIYPVTAGQAAVLRKWADAGAHGAPAVAA